MTPDSAALTTGLDSQARMGRGDRLGRPTGREALEDGPEAARRRSARRPPAAPAPNGGDKRVTAEDAHLEEQAAGKGEWRRWGPYVSDRASGTGGDAWTAPPQTPTA